MCWQWNHIPNFNYCRFSSENECEIQTESVVKNPLLAKNTLTQRAFTHNCCAQVSVDFSSINSGDFAGLCALQGSYAFIGITKENEDFYFVVAQRKSEVERWKIGSIDNDFVEIVWKKPVEEVLGKANYNALLKLEFKFSASGDFAYFSYFDKEKNDFVQVDFAKELHFTLDQFVGVRFGLFCYSTIQSGGKATFKTFEYNVL